MNKDFLRINELFYSLQGEARTVGLPTVFIRLTGCPLRCTYCDSAYAFTGGERLSLDQIIIQVQAYQVRHVTVSGGEPLTQPNVFELMRRLCDLGYEVSVETSGALPIEEIDVRVMKVVDIKTPGSGEHQRNRYENFDYITRHDQIKFVICDRQDYDWAVVCVNQYDLSSLCEVLFSPSYEQLKGAELADWILTDQLDVRFQLQLHKILWGDVPGK
ncbi:7-carboxy-7-deazaguanine synthase [Piscirickettsia salmonis]|uniref:7-carboxy-7-deazaguanine synthase n=1 Tax=Piscirickettsia salmonis TaxID=1238 RepID=A0A1L6TAQ4_PISSA|nr:7-carboxy-7-deazaguanine synthase QueE [Piscirickettsia salmonis]AKP73475.1 7-carboxy-7-deazaguanine synthase [Piscirickettsia salmonis LF-89 = ATCC VR-1361]ALB22231.1 7-cyano-7-deazaguanosine (preQ0) biosynthesis protein QueE [Piscirickettsia salmonis]ALY02334.1 7-carboxy-7-deazaguanine synthase [Piscirickettsia salmonis]AMA41851.1 7-carboxy-7-deazaguanine synthase [Piscirickettsia salmonis]AOS34327.1 7-carboxy-7-deazaguanine synthase [Piscirickettsia salmonis]